MMRSIKISNDTDIKIQSMQLLLYKQHKRKYFKKDIIRYALKALADKVLDIGEGEADGDE